MVGSGGKFWARGSGTIQRWRKSSKRFSQSSRSDAQTSDLWLRIIALVLAFLLWTATKSDSRKVIRNVPVQVINADAGWVAVGPPVPDVVDVRVAGPVRELFRLTSGRAVVQVRVDQIIDSIAGYALRPSQVQLFDGADSTRVEVVLGDSVRIRFEEVVERLVPVRVPRTGVVRPGLLLDGSVQPLSILVRVTGPRSRVAALDSISVAPVDFSTLAASDTLRLAVDTTDLGLLTVLPASVDVVVPLRPAADTTAVSDVALVPRRR